MMMNLKIKPPYGSLAVGLVLGLVTLAWLLRSATDSSTESTYSARIQSAEAPSSTKTTISSEDTPLLPSVEADAPAPSEAPAPLFPPGPSQGLNDPRWKQWNEMERKDRSFQWKTPIRFYGKVVDEEGNPVKGAEIFYGWTSMLGSPEAKTQSDAGGLFKITGIRGKVLEVIPSHPDYHFSRQTNRTAFDYAAFYEPHYHVPDPKSPVVFQMVKKGVPEPLMEFQRRFVEFNQDRVLEIKLPGELTLVWKLLESRWDHDPAKRLWKAELRVEGAQLQPCMEEFPRVAPAEGYKSQIELSLSTPQPPKWISDEVGGRFFVKSEKSGYGILEIIMSPGSKQAHVKYLHNPTNSRNLEIDRRLVRRQ